MMTYQLDPKQTCQALHAARGAIANGYMGARLPGDGFLGGGYRLNENPLEGHDIRRWLEAAGFTVTANGDTGGYSFAETACGLRVTSSGFVLPAMPATA